MWYLANPLNAFLAALPLAAALYFLFRRRTAKMPQLIALAAPPELWKKRSRRVKWIFRGIFLATLISLGGFAFVSARPTQVTSWVEKWSEGIDIMLVVDLSESMEATDFEPSRMVAARAVIRDFIRRRSEDRIGLVAFGGEAVTKCPLTRDYDFLLTSVEEMRSGELKQGTAIGMGLANAVGRLRHSKAKTRIVILLTDGDSNVGAVNPITAATLARQDGIKIYTIGIGKSDRVLVPIYSHDPFGRKRQLVAQVPSYLNPELLKEISRLTGGKAFLARDPGMLNRILREIDSLEKTKVKGIPRERKDEVFFWPALAATLLMLAIYLLQETRFRKARLRHAAAL
jgi:Ca-activated chloride channel homolog